jgi:hypothetical protein
MGNFGYKTMMAKFFCKICHKEYANRTRYDMYLHVQRMHLDRIVNDGMKAFLEEVPEVASMDFEQLR